MTRPLLLLVTATLLLGCPPPPAAQAPATPSAQEPREALVLKARGVTGTPASLQQGGTLDLDISTAPGEDDALFGALLADPQHTELTQWHVEPAGAASVDPMTLIATFNQPGEARLWATWESPHGPVRSNALVVTVTAPTAGE